jgi:hypothetical protein
VPSPELDEPLSRKIAFVLEGKGGVVERRSPSGGEKEDDHIGVAAADPAGGLDPVHVRHAHVEQDQLGSELLDQVQCLPPRRGATDHFEPRSGRHDDSHDVAEHLAVVHYEHADRLLILAGHLRNGAIWPPLVTRAIWIKPGSAIPEREPPTYVTR